MSAVAQVAGVALNHRSSIVRPGAAWMLTLVACCLLVGCQRQASDRIAVHPVSGQVKIKGKPIANALVVLHPKTKSDPKLIAARGQTDQDGNFQLTTYDANDGAAEGEYAVTVVKYELKKQGESFVPGPNVLPGKLATPDTTDIFVKVAAGPNQLQPINIKR